MVHGFKIENDKLILDVEEILQYPLLQQIYARDDSKDKSFAEKEKIIEEAKMKNMKKKNGSIGSRVNMVNDFNERNKK